MRVIFLLISSWRFSCLKNRLPSLSYRSKNNDYHNIKFCHHYSSSSFLTLHSLSNSSEHINFNKNINKKSSKPKITDSSDMGSLKQEKKTQGKLYSLEENVNNEKEKNNNRNDSNVLKVDKNLTDNFYMWEGDILVVNILGKPSAGLYML